MDGVIVDRIKRVTFEDECCDHIFGTWEAPGVGWTREEWREVAEAVEYTHTLYWDICESLVLDETGLGGDLYWLDELGVIVEEGRASILEWLFPELVRTYAEVMYL